MIKLNRIVRDILKIHRDLLFSVSHEMIMRLRPRHTSVNQYVSDLYRKNIQSFGMKSQDLCRLCGIRHEEICSFCGSGRKLPLTPGDS